VDSFHQNNDDKVVHDKTREAHKERDRQKEKKEGSKKHKPNIMCVQEAINKGSSYFQLQLFFLLLLLLLLLSTVYVRLRNVLLCLVSSFSLSLSLARGLARAISGSNQA
jgi:hypothetical protein